MTYSTRKKATRYFFSDSFSFNSNTKLKLYGVFQRQRPVVVQIGWGVFDTAQRKCLDRAIGGGFSAIDHAHFIEPFNPEVVHEVVGVIRRGVAGGALTLTEENILTTDFVLRGFGGVELTEDVKLRCGREVEQLLKLRHELHLTAALQDIYAYALSQHRIAVEVCGALFEFGEVLHALQRAL